MIGTDARKPGEGAPGEGDEERIGILRLRLGDQVYAAPLEDVLEVVTLSEWTRLFRLPAHILGVLNLRGYICPLVDLGRLLGIETGLGSVAVRVRCASAAPGRAADRPEAAFLVDDVLNVAWVPASGIAPIPMTVEERRRPFFRGLVPGTPATLLLAFEQAFRPEYWGAPHA